MAAAALLLAACGSDPPASNGGTSLPPGGTGGNGSSTIPTGCTNEVQRSSLPAFASGDEDGTRVQSLGPRTVGDTVHFEIPEGTVSFTIVEQAVSAPLSIGVTLDGSAFTVPNTAVPLQVLQPDQSEFFNDNTSLPDDLSTTTDPVVFLSSSPGTGTLTAPNTSAGLALVADGLPSGTWSLQVSDLAYKCAIFDSSSSINCGSSGDRTSMYDVTVITKNTGAIPTAGTIDLAIYFATSAVGGSELKAETAASDHDLNRMVSTLKSIYAEAGITIGDPTYHDLPDAQTTYATGVNVDLEGPCSPLAKLLKQANPGNTLNIFLVSRLTSSEGNVVGIDGTIPGPASIGGTVASGAAVSVEDLRQGSGSNTFCPPGAPLFLNARNDGCGADNLAYAIAHEAGHFMGLYHTTERQGLLFDPLGDTAKCPCDRCASESAMSAAGEVCSLDPPAGKEPHLMDGLECSSPTTGCGGADNLMFWALGRQAAGLLTDGQKQVMRANPLVQ